MSVVFAMSTTSRSTSDSVRIAAAQRTDVGFWQKRTPRLAWRNARSASYGTRRFDSIDPVRPAIPALIHLDDVLARVLS